MTDTNKLECEVVQQLDVFYVRRADTGQLWGWSCSQDGWGLENPHVYYSKRAAIRTAKEIMAGAALFRMAKEVAEARRKSPILRVWP